MRLSRLIRSLATRARKVCRRHVGWLVRKHWRALERIGIHITPVHYYYPIPEINALSEEVFQRRSDLIGIDMNPERQLDLLSQFESKYKSEYENLPRQKTSCPHQFFLDNERFGNVDAQILWCMIRHLKPKRIIEIGSGYSTLLAAEAVLKNQEENIYCQCELVAIEPYPNPLLLKGFPGLSKLMLSPVQQVPLTEFEALTTNDILCIDSSHALKIGGDVQYEYLEILPRLRAGAMVHVHDIFLPAEYPSTWVLDRHVFWNEQYLLQAFLTFNNKYEVCFAGRYMCLNYPDRIAAAFSAYKGEDTWPTSFWMRRVE